MKLKKIETHALAVAIVLMALFALLAPHSPSGDDPAGAPPSTFLNGERGASALYFALEDLEVPVGRALLPFPDFARTRGPFEALAILSPAELLTPSEALWLWSWVEGGGRLFYVPGRGRDYFLDKLGIELEARYFPLAREAPPARRAGGGPLDEEGLSTEARDLLSGSPETIAGFHASFSIEGSSADSAEVLYATGGSRSRGVVAVFRVGEGEVTLFSHAGPILNGELRESGAATLAVRALAQLSQGETVWFDELHHGFDERGSLERSLWRFLSRTSEGWALLQLGCLGVVAIFFAGIRLGGPVPPAPPRRRSSLEHVRALSSAYLAAGTKKRAAALILDGLRLRLGARSQEELDERLAGLALHEPAIQEAAASIARSRREEDIVSLSAAVDRLLAATGDPEARRGRKDRLRDPEVLRS